MAEKRRDSKGRILQNGESQRKDGRYAYKYIDAFGNPQFVYSWKLVKTDRTPAGKREDISLREKIKDIKRDIDDGIDTIGKKLTVCQLYEKKNNQRKNIKRNTEIGRQCFMNILKKDPLGVRSIDTVKPSDAKEWAIRMSENGYSYKTINNYKRSLKASFYMAIQDDCIRKNPFEFKLSDILDDDTEEKIALTPAQVESLLSFMETDNIYQKYYDEIIILLETGLRISEFCGITKKLDMKNRIINVDHQLLRDSEIGYYVAPPKTTKGNRQIPMTERAYQAFQRILKNHSKGKAIVIDGYKDFLFLNHDGLPKTSGNYDGMVRGLIKKYNKNHTGQLPNVTPHTFRHTFCTNMANKGMNPNTLQYIMGHSNIAMTLGYYAHGSFDSAKAEMERLVA
ncbi:tyrosine-type recombinase/integrase [Hespellia stercorisuis]|uniref:Site-specific recombinase XerD n=1 Tax=Hespellia stercorisuis DSM 15480 TaxID=1121950 RepID=A0A1M6VA90_9FIRM|nr:tyrosine-type recombinase/integrase [Hespellia stercorisuis]SHK78402.1 Site-specific recombinase XerD [Hespellia stercorisuis DSM 15480]